jgi:hypothetical protein
VFPLPGFVKGSLQKVYAQMKTTELSASFTFPKSYGNLRAVKRRDFFEKWGLSGLKINLGWLESEFSPQDPDREAAWELYIELLTRISTQHLLPEDGDEKSALDSIYAIFPLTREILRSHGAGCGEFAKLAIPVLNQIIRPFTAKWHRLSMAGAFRNKASCKLFRSELAALQKYLRGYTSALSAMANVEDLTELEAT